MHITGRLCENGQKVRLEIEGAQIKSLEPLAQTYPAGTPAAAEVWISPGWIDLQVNGYGGYDFNCASWTQGTTGDEAPRQIAEALWKSGTAMACPTIVTNSREGMIESLQVLARAVETDKTLSASLPAYHVEGPYISSEEGLRGAHPKEHTRDPNWDEFQQFQEAANGRLKILTLAPEREGAVAFIEKATAAGVVISIGHTGATPQQIRDAVKAGARLSTHLGNGSQNMIQRHSNYFFEQLAADEVTACIIPDGHHIPPELAKIIARAKGEEKLILVSDAVALGGMAPGIYDDGRHEVLPTGKVVLAGTPYLAGAGHLLDDCAANILRWGTLSPSGLAKTAATNPARVLGLPNTGKVEAGYDADLTIYRETESGPLDIMATVLKGEVLYQGQGADFS
jgi:N-acetylglucosamine-6-phosphate deacetylase